MSTVICEYSHIQAEEEEEDTRERIGVVLDNGGVIPIWHTGRLQRLQRPTDWIGNGPKG